MSPLLSLQGQPARLSAVLELSSCVLRPFPHDIPQLLYSHLAVVSRPFKVCDGPGE